MRVVFLCALVIGCASAQYVKSGVKGGYGGQGYHHRAAENFVSLFGNRTQGTVQHGSSHEQTAAGVCFKEVPTASLVKDPRHVPAGNGSRPDLSVIRACCPGYERNIHNARLCDPVCSNDCVNSICTAPETCTCYPDHVRNYAGACVPTCPIGCQNGRCAGGECICHDGFILDPDSKYCIPICKENCGGIGNCTGVNQCSCRPGYQSTPEGSCKPVCERCTHGDCVAPHDCRCHQGYNKDPRGECISQCVRGCGPNEICAGPNICAPAPHLNPGHGPVQPNYQPGSYPGYPGHRNQSSLPYYPTQGSTQNSTSTYFRPDYPGPRPYYPYPQNPVNHDQNQYPGGSPPNYIVQPVGHPYNPPPSDNLLSNYSTPNGSRPYQPNQPGYEPGYPGHRNQSSLPYYPNQGSTQNSTTTYFRPDYPSPRPYNPYSQNPVNHDQNQFPGQYPSGLPPNYIVQPIGHPNNTPPYGNLLSNYSSPNGSRPYDTNQPGYQPGYPGYPGYPSYPLYPGYQPGYQPGQIPSHGYPANQTYPGYMPNYYFQPGYYQPNLTFPNQFYQGQQPAFRPGLYYQPMYPNPYFSPSNTSAGQPGLFPYPGNTTSNQPWYPQPNYVNVPNGTSQPGANLTSHQVYPSNRSPTPNYPEPSNSYPTQGVHAQDHMTNQSPNLFNPYTSDSNKYGQQNICSPPCVNGECVGENRCSCHQGYMTDHSDPSGSRCKPVCIGGCVNGVCSAPNVCICSEGYSMDTSVKGRMMCVKRIRRSAAAPMVKA